MFCRFKALNSILSPNIMKMVFYATAQSVYIFTEFVSGAVLMKNIWDHSELQ